MGQVPGELPNRAQACEASTPERAPLDEFSISLHRRWMSDSPTPEVMYAIIDRGFSMRITSGARKHGLTRRRIEEALGAHQRADTVFGDGDPRIHFIGRDRRGEEIEVVAIVLPALLLVIHAMPTRYRRRSS